MNTFRLKLLAVTLFAAAAIFMGVPRTELTANAEPVVPDDLEAFYKTKCAMCHGPKAAKAFDPERTDEEHVISILDGKKAEKPPHMPGYRDKGVDEEKAQALVALMRQLRTPPAE
ncbi:MAG TPA: cytochrome c [Pyrinomonadaceae bacterium]|nr:cytochrome c [Pyrinomonadaceae bacterium]